MNWDKNQSIDFFVQNVITWVILQTYHAQLCEIYCIPFSRINLQVEPLLSCTHLRGCLSFHFQLQVPTLPYCRVEIFFYFNSCGAVFWEDKGGHFFSSTLTHPSDVVSGAQRPLSPFPCAWLPVTKMCRTSPSQPWCWNLCVSMRCWYKTSSAST